MGTIGILNIISFLLILAVIVILTYTLFKQAELDGSLILIIISFLVLLLVNITNVLEHLNITSYFDLYEDDIEIIFIPLFIFSVFSYCLKKELKENTKKEQSIKESNIRLDTSVKGAIQALWEWHPQTNTIVINKGHYYLNFELLFYRITPNNYKEIIHPDSESNFNALLHALISNSNLPNDTELQIKTTSNSYEWVLFRGARTDAELKNRDYTYLGTIIDIAIFKNVQFELEAARLKAEESERLKTAFLNNISHEIRTPMNAIIGFSDLITDTGISQEKQKKYLKMIIHGSERLIHIIDNLIEMSKIVAGLAKSNIKLIKSDVFFEKLYEKFSKRIASKGISFKVNYNPLLTFNTDEEKLNVIFTNLLDNAIKFTNEGVIEFGMNETKNNLQFYVADTGIGIDKKYLPSIFDYFKKIEITSSQFYAGTGLGLSICKGLVKVLTGEIYIDSELGKGTSVYFTLPVNSTENITKINSINNNVVNVKQNSKVLIAEDEDSNYHYLHEVLSPFFGTILWAKTGKEAIDLFKENRDILLILMDLKMPVIDGYEAARYIKNIDPKITIIAQSAYILSLDSDTMHDHIFSNFISKPAHRDALLHILKQYLNI